MQRRNTLRALACGSMLFQIGSASGQAPVALDAADAAWDGLLKKHVQWLPDGKQSRVDYAGFAADRAALQKVLGVWSAVSPTLFSAASREQQMAFLINAYNGFTVELILSAYPKLKSIKDLGSLIQSPWKKRFFTLLGESRHLDWIEHEQLRPRYNDPRVHAAVNCASIGCPALRPEVFTASRLGAQLDDGMQRFMSDRTRNRFADGKLQVSMIFKWFREDFEQGHLGFEKLEDVMVRYADLLSGNPAERDRIRSRQVAITFLDYDWSLNDLRR
ncbi:MAG TPA: DUF547 domain-containing protein [Burkholderiaceae bacterium]|nr:DUF547 domain-containing protein [Burkholderiaceae bacterium]